MTAYNQDIEATDPVRRDGLVVQRAFAAGLSRKQIALMLSAESPYVKQLVHREGKRRAIAYVNRVVQVSCQQKHYLERTYRYSVQMEL